MIHCDETQHRLIVFFFVVVWERCISIYELILGLPSQTIGEDGAVNNQNVINEWIQRDADARLIIFCNIELAQQSLVEGCTSAADMWDRLVLQYADAAPINSTLLIEKFFNYKYNPSKE